MGQHHGESHIIFLHGASSSGKSTLARALQSALPLPFWHISIDHLRDSGVLPLARYKSGEFDWSEGKERFFNGYHASLAAYAQAGNHLILEHILDREGWFEGLVQRFAPFRVFFIGLHCPADELVARERARGDRPIGSALQDFHNIHSGLSYDLELNSLDGVEKNVQRILDTWQGQTGPTIFQQALKALP